MAKHFLYRSQIGTAVYQVCGKRMPERMRTDAFFNPGFKSKAFDELEHGYSGQACAARIEKNIIFIAIFNRNMNPDLGQIDLYEFQCCISYRYQPFFISFSGNFNEFIFRM